jgi:ankyrin repeat protein
MKNNWTALHYAAHKCAGEEARLQVMRELLEPDVECVEPGDINTKDSSGRTPLHIAAKMGDIKLGELLLQHNADKNAVDSYHHSILDLAIESNHEKFVELLLCKRVDDGNVSEEYQQRFGELKGTIAFRKITAAQTRTTKSNTKAVKKQQSCQKPGKILFRKSIHHLFLPTRNSLQPLPS